MDIAALGYKIEYAQIDAATKSLNAMAAAAERAQGASSGLSVKAKPVTTELNNEATAANKAAKSTDLLADAIASANRLMPSLAQEASAAGRSMTGLGTASEAAQRQAQGALTGLAVAIEAAGRAQNKAATDADKYIKKLQDEAMQAGKTSAQIRQMEIEANAASLEKLGLTDKAKELRQYAAAHGDVAKAAINSGYHVRNMSYQLVDVTQGLLTGQPIFMVAAQQLGQIGQIAAFSGLSLKQWAIEFGIMLGILQRVPAVNAEVSASNIAVASTATAAAAANQAMATTAAEAATAEAIALAPLAPIIAAVAAALAVLGAGFFSLKSAANDAADNKEFLKSLGLTKKQIDGIKDSGVTAGDVFHGLGTTIGDLWKAFDGGGRITSALGAAFDWLGDKVGGVVHSILKGAEYSVAAAIGLGRALVATWSAIPGALGDIIISVTNYTLATIQGMINSVIAGINSLLQMTHLDGMFSLSNVNLGQISNPFAGQAAKWGTEFGAEFAKGFTQSVAAMDKTISNIIDASHKRLKGKYGDLADTADNAATEAVDPRYVVAKRENEDITPWAKFTQLSKPVKDGITLVEDFGKKLTDLPRLLTPVQDAFESFGKAIGRSLGYAIANSRDLGDAVSQVFRQMEAEYIANKISQIFSMIGKAFGTAGNDNPIINEISSFFTGEPTANAKGGVYSSPSLSAFSGGVYNSPQTFAFAKGAGVFAEAGPEAIMPLSRGPDGKLGVKANTDSQGFDMGQAVATLASALTSHIAKTSAAVSGRAVYKYDRALPTRLGSVSRLGT